MGLCRSDEAGVSGVEQILHAAVEPKGSQRPSLGVEHSLRVRDPVHVCKLEGVVKTQRDDTLSPLDPAVRAGPVKAYACEISLLKVGTGSERPGRTGRSRAGGVSRALAGRPVRSRALALPLPR